MKRGHVTGHKRERDRAQQQTAKTRQADAELAAKVWAQIRASQTQAAPERRG